MTEFDDELENAKAKLEAARRDLLAVVEEADGRFDAARRGHWNAGQVLQHVIDAENQWATGIKLLRGGTPARPAPVDGPMSATAARHELELSRQRLLEALAGVDEETFYRMGSLGHQGYSVLSVLENVQLHDHEHTAQIRQLLGE